MNNNGVNNMNNKSNLNNCNNANNSQNYIGGVRIVPPTNNGSAPNSGGTINNGNYNNKVNNMPNVNNGGQPIGNVSVPSNLQTSFQKPNTLNTIQQSNNGNLNGQNSFNNSNSYNSNTVETKVNNETNSSDNKNSNDNSKNIDKDKKNIKKNKTKKTNNSKNLLPLFIIIIVLLIFALLFMNFTNKKKIQQMIINCTPVSTTKGSKELDLNSTIVKDLYSKVQTNIREDLAQPELNDELRRYLAFRQIPSTKIYESFCNMFKDNAMEPFVCKKSGSFIPNAFKEETLQLELKKLFGEQSNIANGNIQLGNSCIGGYQYIADRGEYVQGQCKSIGTTLYSARKELIGATSNESTIVLKERVKYYGSEGIDIPEKLKSGVYSYTFKLDTNYNYVYVSKTLEI